MIECGIDIIEIERIEKAISRNPAFKTKVYSTDELEYYEENGKRTETLAGFFAAKEAFLKYMGTGLGSFRLCDISVCHREAGAPYIKLCGRVQNVSLSISHNRDTAVATVCGVNSELMRDDRADFMKELIPIRAADANKGSCGRVLVIAGSRGMIGAGVLSAYSALRTGCGLVTLAVPECERAIAAGFYPEVMTVGLPTREGKLSSTAIPEVLSLAKRCDSVVFGPGLGRSDDMVKILVALLTDYMGKLVIDADGLNALSENSEILKSRRAEVILTPHPVEMSRLTGLGVSEIQQRRIETAEELSNKTAGVCVVLKGAGTVVAMNGKPTYVNNTGNEGMATAGTGDVLSGIVASFAAQGLGCFDAAELGVYIHGLSGDFAAKDKGVHGLLAGDVADNIPQAILRTLGECR